MKCRNCGSSRSMYISGKTSDLCWAEFCDTENSGYVPSIPGVLNGGDYLEFRICMECGMVAGTFPVSNAKISKAIKAM